MPDEQPTREGDNCQRHDNCGKCAKCDATRRLRYALMEGLKNCGPEVTAHVVMGSFACAMDFTDPVECAAYKMAETAVLAIAKKDEPARAAVRSWDAQRRGCTSMDTLSILQIAEAVQVAVYLYHCSKDPIEPKGRAAIAALQTFISRRFGSNASLEDLEDLIGRHAPKHTRGKVTTAGVVARIVHGDRLLGARGKNESKTLRRVDRDLSRLKSGWSPVTWPPKDKGGIHST